MDKRAAFIISLIMGIIAVLMVKNYVSQQKAVVNKGLDLVSVVVAGKNLEKGEVISDANIRKGDYPEKFVGERVVRVENFSMIIGQKIKNNVEQGKPILWSDIDLEKGDGFASVIKPGMRAVTVPVNALSSISNMIKPGSRVDIILTFDKARVEKAGSEDNKKETAEIPDVKDIQAFREYLMKKYSKQGQSKQMSIVLKQDILVLAVGQRYIGEDSSSKKGESYSDVTLLVSLLGAQEIIHALTMGTLSFVLRNDADVERKVVTPTTDDSLFRSAITASISQTEGDEEKSAEKPAKQPETK